MKKIYCCLTWAVLTLALTACSNNQKPAEPTKETKATVETPAAQEATHPASKSPSAEQPVVPPPPVQEAVPPADQAPPADQPAAPAAAPHK